jgi:cell division transport system permease protein
MVSIYRIIKTAISYFWRNKFLSLAAIFVMTLTLVTINLFVILNLIVSTNINSIKERIDLKIYFKDEVKESEIVALASSLKELFIIKDIKYISKEEALNRWRKQFKDKELLANLLSEEYNPLPRTIEITLSDPSGLEKIMEFLENDKYKILIKDTSYSQNKNVVKNLLSVLQFIKNSGLFLSLLFIFISALVMFNTLRLTIFTRREEIEIMKLVGATSSFIRWPFILEGLFYGIFATVFSTGIIYLSAYFLSPKVSSYLGLPTSLFSYLLIYLPHLLIFQIIIVMFIGLLCSNLALWRYLRIWSRK